MSAKRSTPQNRVQSNRVAQNLNSTTVFGRQLSFPKFRSGSASKLQKTQSFLDFTVAGGSGCPAIKATIGAPLVDHDLECDFVYSEYLQSVMKREIASNAVRKHEQDLKDQLAIHNDNLHKIKVMFKKNQQEVRSLSNLKEIGNLLRTVGGNIDTFSRLKAETDLEGILKQLLLILDTFSKKMHVKNVKLITDQEGFDKLLTLLEKLEGVAQKVRFLEQHTERVNQLAGLLQKFREVLVSVVEKQSLMRDLHKNGTYKLLKNISDMYVERERYEKSIC